MEKNTVDYLINYLLSERDDLRNIEIPDNDADKFRLYRSLVNIRPAWKADERFLQAEDAYLTGLTESKGITDIDELDSAEDGINLWQGDITTLRCGAIVNAANSGMTGCWHPCHSCIDNCIHSQAFGCVMNVTASCGNKVTKNLQARQSSLRLTICRVTT